LDFDDEKRDEARFERRKKGGDERGEDGDEDRWVGAAHDDLERLLKIWLTLARLGRVSAAT
jgi:hypothetical protein